jgi:hypothetical protein
VEEMNEDLVNLFDPKSQIAKLYHIILKRKTEIMSLDQQKIISLLFQSNKFS